MAGKKKQPAAQPRPEDFLPEGFDAKELELIEKVYSCLYDGRPAAASVKTDLAKYADVCSEATAKAIAADYERPDWAESFAAKVQCSLRVATVSGADPATLSSFAIVKKLAPLWKEMRESYTAWLAGAVDGEVTPSGTRRLSVWVRFPEASVVLRKERRERGDVEIVAVALDLLADVDPPLMPADWELSRRPDVLLGSVEGDGLERQLQSQAGASIAARKLRRVVAGTATWDPEGALEWVEAVVRMSPASLRNAELDTLVTEVFDRAAEGRAGVQASAALARVLVERTMQADVALQESRELADKVCGLEHQLAKLKAANESLRDEIEVLTASAAEGAERLRDLQGRLELSEAERADAAERMHEMEHRYDLDQIRDTASTNAAGQLLDALCQAIDAPMQSLLRWQSQSRAEGASTEARLFGRSAEKLVLSLKAVGLEPIGAPGEVIDFDAVLHRLAGGSAGLGERVRVVESGWSAPDAAGDVEGARVIKRALVEPAAISCV